MVKRKEHYIELFEKQVKLTPQKIAIYYQKDKISYEELNNKANIIAKFLKNNGIKNEDIIGLLDNPSINFVISILAIFKVGGVYLPLDVKYPENRIKYILEDSQLKMILSSKKYVKLVTGYKVFEIEEILIKDTIESNLNINYNLNNLAYIIYTSGSTGKSKGVMIEHKGMINHILAKIEDLHLNEKCKIAQNSSPCFDISVWQFLSALIIGGSVEIFRNIIYNVPRFIQRLTENKITILEVIPSYLKLILDSIKDTEKIFTSLDYILVTGEIVNPNLVKIWFELFPNIKMVNAYGPTEASDDVTHYIMDKYPNYSTIPIGKPIKNMKIYIVDNNLNLCAKNEKGEILISGIGVGRGYINNKEKTDEVFLYDPFCTGDKTRYYKSGDIGSFLEDGNLLFFGRIDNQVKINGHRIELDEIDSVIHKHTNIEHSITIVNNESSDSNQLTTFIKCNKNYDESKFLSFLKNTLPSYMIPQNFIKVKNFPLTSNGKVDRKKISRMNVNK